MYTLKGAPKVEKEIFEMGVPILGICYGAQLMAQSFGGEVITPDVREYGKIEVDLSKDAIIFEGIDENQCWMSHTDHISTVPEGFDIIATTKDCPVAAMANVSKKLYGVQFHPEVKHTLFGEEMIRKFLYDVCEVKGDWSMSSFADRKNQGYKRTSWR